MAALNIQLQPGDIQTDMVVNRETEAAVSLHPGNSLYSPAGAFRFTLQLDDGNAVLEVIDDFNLPNLNWIPIWATFTQNQNASHVDLQFDGNLVVYNAEVPLWNSGTHGNDLAFLRMQDDGNLVLYSQDGSAVLWQSNTSARTSAGVNA
jgi:hypothetical protein